MERTAARVYAPRPGEEQILPFFDSIAVQIRVLSFDRCVKAE